MQPPAQNIETLANVEVQADFEALYKNSNLSSTEDKIKFLRDSLGILAIRHGKNISPGALLKDLESYALSHPWLYKNEGY
jgi:hypothetical protein